jgi:assimilatory nitrate reductase catalytic subunit
LKADQLPGYRKLADPTDRAHVAQVWGVDPDELPAPGVSAYEMLDRLGTDAGVRVLLVGASNPVVSAPNAAHVAEQLAALDLLVVTDFFPSETARLADVVLPTTQFAEEEGTLTNLEGRVLRRRRAADPPPGVRTELQIWHGLAQRLGRGEFFSPDPHVVYDELRRASAGGIADYAGISWERLDAGEELFWPCPDESHPGTPRLFTESFPTPDGRARFVAVTARPVTEAVDNRWPFLLTTGRSRTHYQSGAQTRRNPALLAAEPSAYAEIHPELAARVGVGDGDAIRLSTRRGSLVVSARLSDGIRRDTVFVPFHWARVNDLTSDRLDPTSRMPEFKACAVAVTAVRTRVPVPSHEEIIR